MESSRRLRPCVGPCKAHYQSKECKKVNQAGRNVPGTSISEQLCNSLKSRILVCPSKFFLKGFNMIRWAANRTVLIWRETVELWSRCKMWRKCHQNCQSGLTASEQTFSLCVCVCPLKPAADTESRWNYLNVRPQHGQGWNRRVQEWRNCTKKKKKKNPPVSETSVFHTAAQGKNVCEFVCACLCVSVRARL